MKEKIKFKCNDIFIYGVVVGLSPSYDYDTHDCFCFVVRIVRIDGPACKDHRVGKYTWCRILDAIKWDGK